MTEFSYLTRLGWASSSSPTRGTPRTNAGYGVFFCFFVSSGIYKSISIITSSYLETSILFVGQSHERGERARGGETVVTSVEEGLCFLPSTPFPPWMHQERSRDTYFILAILQHNHTIACTCTTPVRPSTYTSTPTLWVPDPWLRLMRAQGWVGAGNLVHRAGVASHLITVHAWRLTPFVLALPPFPLPRVFPQTGPSPDFSLCHTHPGQGCVCARGEGEDRCAALRRALVQVPGCTPLRGQGRSCTLGQRRGPTERRRQEDPRGGCGCNRSDSVNVVK